MKIENSRVDKRKPYPDESKAGPCRRVCPGLLPRIGAGRTEVQVGDLVSEEQRIAVFFLQVLPIPLVAPGKPAATLDGEALMDVEIAYDEVTDVGVASHTERHTIRVRPTQDAADVQVNETVLPWVTA